jgi:limonene-1,2-epoxide hydrolase
MLENSGKLTEMVNESGAHSTEVNNPESVEHLCATTKQYALNWAPRAKALSEEFKTFTTSNEALRVLNERDDSERVAELTRNATVKNKAKART